jgi:hypothetical protein
LDIAHTNQYQVSAQVDKVESIIIQSTRDNLADLFDLHCFESDAEHLEFIDSFRADNKYHFPGPECVDGGVRVPNLMQRVLKAASKWPASTLLPGRSNPAVYLHQILSSAE